MKSQVMHHSVTPNQRYRVPTLLQGVDNVVMIRLPVHGCLLEGSKGMEPPCIVVIFGCHLPHRPCLRWYGSLVRDLFQPWLPGLEIQRRGVSPEIPSTILMAALSYGLIRICRRAFHGVAS